MVWDERRQPFLIGMRRRLPDVCLIRRFARPQRRGCANIQRREPGHSPCAGRLFRLGCCLDDDLTIWALPEHVRRRVRQFSWTSGAQSTVQHCFPPSVGLCRPRIPRRTTPLPEGLPGPVSVGNFSVSELGAGRVRHDTQEEEGRRVGVHFGAVDRSWLPAQPRLPLAFFVVGVSQWSRMRSAARVSRRSFRSCRSPARRLSAT